MVRVGDGAGVGGEPPGEFRCWIGVGCSGGRRVPVGAQQQPACFAPVEQHAPPGRQQGAQAFLVGGAEQVGWESAADCRVWRGGRTVADVESADPQGELSAYRRVCHEFREEGAQRFHFGAAEQEQGLRSDEGEGACRFGSAFLVVAVEEPVGGPSGHVRRQFPAEVEGVVQAEVERLAAHGHLPVRGVPCQEDPPVAVAGGVQARVVEPVGPHHAGSGQVVPGDVVPGVDDVVGGWGPGVVGGPPVAAVDHDAGEAAGVGG